MTWATSGTGNFGLVWFASADLMCGRFAGGGPFVPHHASFPSGGTYEAADGENAQFDSGAREQDLYQPDFSGSILPNYSGRQDH